MDIQREGIDHDPVKPWNWATLPLRTDPVEIVSYPDNGMVNVRVIPGDPTTMKTVPLSLIAAFSPDRHEWSNRARYYYSDNPSVFRFTN